MKKEDRLPFILLGIYFSVMIFLAFYAPGTGDDGDSVTHYLIAHTVFSHPENFFYQWGKPFFVLLASPFAQFGFIGIKIFNVIVTTVAIYFSYRIATQLKILNAWFVVVALACMPMYFRLTLSSLTEPLFACAFVICIFLALRKKLLASIILASFLPFMRSEGLIVLIMFACYLVSIRQYKFIPLLLTGHVIYSIAGFWFYHDFLWVFKTISYATLENAYGSGSWLRFISSMPEMIGWPLIILFIIGSAWGIITFLPTVFKKQSAYSKEELWLVYGGFYSVWIAHMLFWQFGLFKSYGLLRVIIAVLPCAGLISLRGFNALFERNYFSMNETAKRVLQIMLAVLVIISLYTSLNWKRDFDLSGSQKAMAAAADRYRDTLKGYTFYSSFNYADMTFDFDHFDLKQWRPLNWIFTDKKIPTKSAVIWDDFYSQDYRVSFERLLTDDRLEWLQTFEGENWYGGKNKVAVFVYNGSEGIKWKSVDTIYFNDFEHENFKGIDSSNVFAGKKSVRIDDQNPFSPGLGIAVNQLPFQFPAVLQISGAFYCEKISFKKSEHPILVISLDHEGKPFFWQGFDMTDYMKKENEWGQVSFHLHIPAAMDSSDVLKVYIWNPHQTSVFVDNLQVDQLIKE